MTIADFIAKWRRVELKERSAAQEHFIDLCNMFDHPTPAAADPTGADFCFEKGATKAGNAGVPPANGFSDVWKRGFFGWEYKGKHKDLSAAYDQLLRYRDALAKPPLLVVCDLDRIIVHTHFTGTVSDTHAIPLESLDEPRNMEILRAVFHNPETLRPGRTSIAVTQEAAKQFADIAAAMRQRGLDASAVAHFLDWLVFCLFAEDIGLLPDMVFSRLVTRSSSNPARFAKLLRQFFETMATGGDFGLEPVRHFNGNLFDDRSVPKLTVDDMERIAAATKLDWSAVDPSIFGTLFERGLDPAKRAQLGAHFTSRADIELVVDAIVMTPLRRDWGECRETILNLLATGKKGRDGSPSRPGNGAPGESTLPRTLSPTARKKARAEADSILHQFLDRLRMVKILDPACGSGNFLYMALLRLKDLEKEAAVIFPSENGLNTFLPNVGPWQLYGIEINPYAHDLAQMAVWIGWLQWIRANGFGYPAEPILRPLADNIRLMDAIVDATSPPRPGNGEDAASTPKEPEWPRVDYIIGNPPFLGNRIMPKELGQNYVATLFAAYGKRLEGKPDLCCYWFEKARAHIEEGKCRRAGLLATQGIRGGTNRNVLKRIKDTGDIFWAESDRAWVLDGANVHVSMVGFDDGTEKERVLDGKPVSRINANLTSESNTTKAKKFTENLGIGYQGAIKRGSFDIEDTQAIEWLCGGGNPNRQPNSDVLMPYVNGLDVIRRNRRAWIVEFGASSQTEAAMYQGPSRHVATQVKPERLKANQESARIQWWLHWCPRPEMTKALAPLHRFIVTPRVAKHRVFCWQDLPLHVDCQLIAFARADDLFFGILHSRIHELWALAQGTQLREKNSGFRYTPTTCFETFPFLPGVLDANYSESAVLNAIAVAAKELNELRENWLNPPEWTKTEILEFPASVHGPWRRFLAGVEEPAAGVRETSQGWTPRDLFEAEQTVRRATETAQLATGTGTARYPRLVPRDAACAARLKKRTLTRLYNERPAWLATCHAKLDAAVAAAYGFPADLSDDAILERLLALNLSAADCT